MTRIHYAKHNYSFIFLLTDLFHTRRRFIMLWEWVISLEYTSFDIRNLRNRRLRMKNFSCRNVYFVFQSTLTTKVISGLSNKSIESLYFQWKRFKWCSQFNSSQFWSHSYLKWSLFNLNTIKFDIFFKKEI